MQQPPGERVDLSIITVVTQPSEIESLRRLLRSVAESDFSGRMEVIVVSNGLEGEQLRDVIVGSDGVRLLVASKNLGFAGANNWGIVKSRGRLVLLLNNDIVVGKDSLSKLVEFVDSRPDAGGATGKLIGKDGQPQVGFNVRGLPTLWTTFFEMLLLDRLFPKAGVVRRFAMTQMDYDRLQPVEQPAGACLLVRRELIDQVGLMDESFFPIWYEDVDWCMRMKSYGWRLWYVPEAVFYQRGAGSTRQWSKYDAVQVRYRNFAYLCKKHFGVPLSAWVIFLIAVGMLLRIVVVLVGSAFGVDLSERIEHFRRGDTVCAVKGYFKVFRLCVTARL